MSYLDSIGEQVAEMLDTVPEKVRVEVVQFGRDQLLASYKNGIETGRRTQKDGLRSTRPQFARSTRP